MNRVEALAEITLNAFAQLAKYETISNHTLEQISALTDGMTSDELDQASELYRMMRRRISEQLKEQAG